MDYVNSFGGQICKLLSFGTRHRIDINENHDITVTMPDICHLEMLTSILYYDLSLKRMRKANAWLDTMLKIGILVECFAV